MHPEPPQPTRSPVGKSQRRFLRIAKGACLALLLLLISIYLVYILPFWGIPFNGKRHGRVPLTPPWALECWLWEDDVNNAAFIEELLDGYSKHDLPVRTIMIDSPWSTRYNDFSVDEERYPAPERFFSTLQDRGYRVVLWMTCMVNSYSKDTEIKDSPEFFEQARTQGYLAGNGMQIKWWKGRGGFIDYSNPQAAQWWHFLQTNVLSWGIDGWKLDGADTLFSGQIWKLPVPFNRVHSGWMTTRQYMDHYARHEYQNGLKHNPEFVTLIRSIDRPWTHPEGFAPLDAAPVTWVGDNQHTWRAEDRGIEAAIRDILLSAKLGYCVIGSDVAGYHGRSNPEDIGASTAAWLSGWKTNATNDPLGGDQFGTASGSGEIAPNIYIRWAQFSTFCGLFLNGGHGERRLWKRTPAELEIIRKFSWLHTELVPYMYSHVVKCHRGGQTLMRPLPKGTFHYLFGEDLLVAPIHEDSLSRTVSLPSGQWRYLFGDAELLQGPCQLTREFPMDEFPVYVREGAIIPLKVSRPYTGWGNKSSEGFTTWLIYPTQTTNRFTLWHPETHPHPESTQAEVTGGNSLRIQFSGRKQPHILRVLSQRKPAAVQLDSRQLQEGSDWTYAANQRSIQVRTESYTNGSYLISWDAVP